MRLWPRHERRIKPGAPADAAFLVALKLRVAEFTRILAVWPLSRFHPKSGDFGYFSSKCVTSKAKVDLDV